MLDKLRMPVEDILRWVEAVDTDSFNDEQLKLAETIRNNARELLTFFDKSSLHQISEDNDVWHKLYHDLRQLTLIIGAYCRVLAAGVLGPLDSDLVRQFGRIESTANYVEALIEDTFGFTPAYLGEPPKLAKEQFNLAIMIRKIAEQRLSEKDHELKIEDVLPLAYGEWSRTNSLISMLLSLMTWFAPNEPIMLEAHLIGDNIEVIVKSEALRFTTEQIFDAGLVLAREKAFAEWQRGSLRFENEPCATFLLTIPAAFSPS